MRLQHFKNIAMRNCLIIAIILVASHIGMSQQTPQYTQYMFNDFVINPAIAGIHDYYQIRLTNRYQWVGLKDAPATYVLSAYGPHKSMPMGWGGYIYSDNQGPTGKIGAYGAYGYNINIQSDINLSMGLSIGLIQYKIDVSKIDFLEEEYDLERKKYTYLRPDASAGVYVYSTQYFGGVSVDQLFNSKVVLERDSSINTFNRLKSHFTVMGGYKLNINRDIDLEPSMLFRATGKVLPQFELTVKGVYKRMVWAALAFRTSDAVALLAGYNYKDQIYVGYSADITYSMLRKTSVGSHEIMIGARFNKIRSRSRPKM